MILFDGKSADQTRKSEYRNNGCSPNNFPHVDAIQEHLPQIQTEMNAGSNVQYNGQQRKL